MDKVIFFESFVFSKGLNVTVRRGTKWMQDNPMNIDVTERYTKRFKDLHEIELHSLHDKKLTIYSSLLQTMKQYYPDFREDEVVTIIWFRVDK